jgi:hypothetical protein
MRNTLVIVSKPILAGQLELNHKHPNPNIPSRDSGRGDKGLHLVQTRWVGVI